MNSEGTGTIASQGGKWPAEEPQGCSGEPAAAGQGGSGTGARRLGSLSCAAAVCPVARLQLPSARADVPTTGATAVHGPAVPKEDKTT